MKRREKRKPSKITLKTHRKHKPLSREQFPKLYREKVIPNY